MRRKKRVRIHLIDPNPHMHLPSVEGLLVSSRGREYLVALPQLITTAEGNPVTPEGRLLAIPRGNVAFYEVL